jgi:putative endonuclease
MFYVYVLYSYKDKKLYTGYSDDLKIRIAKHKEGKVPATKHRLPLELVYYEAYRDKRDATKREYFLKSGRGRELLKTLIPNSIPEE